MAIAALLAGTLLTLLAGCGGQARNSAGPSATRAGGPAAHAVSGSAPASPGPTAAATTITARLPVVSCPTTVAIAPAPAPVTMPSSRLAAVPAAAAARLAVYADTRGTMALVGPRDWKCAAAYGADGSGGLVIYPPGTPAPPTANAVWKLGQTTPMGIYGTESSACFSCTVGQACPLFPAAATAFRSSLGHGCTARPATEKVTTVSSGIVSFEDPPGVRGDATPSGGQYPASAVMTYYPNAPDGSWLETCTLPGTDKAECTAALNTFLAWYGSR